jgi:hypothetical protein
MGTASEFDLFMLRGFQYGGLNFRVPGDASTANNNCLFASIIMSNLIPYGDAAALRHAVFRYHSSGQPGKSFATSLYPLFARGDETFETFMHQMSTTDMMASDFEMALIAMQFGINVVSFSNQIGGIERFDAFQFIRKFLKSYSHLLIPDPQTAFIYHHQFRRPLTARPVQFLNHFCPLLLLEDLNVPAFAYASLTTEVALTAINLSNSDTPQK